MKRNHVLWVLSIASVGLAGLVTTIAPVRDARGCGGQQWACVAQARTAASWEVDPTGVPTDGAVRVHVEEESTCGYASGGGSPSITV